MADPVRKLNAAELAPVAGPLSSDDLLRLQEFIERVGGIEVARDLLETLDDLSSEDGLDELDDIDEDVDLADLDCDDEDADDCDQIAA